MPNVGRPSRDCESCRKRRVKCDLKRPGCTQCLRKCQPCPGYRDELEMHLRRKDFVSFELGRQQGVRRRRTNVGSSKTSAYERLGCVGELEATSINSHLKPPSSSITPPPWNLEIFDRTFIAQFVARIRNKRHKIDNKHAWLLKLPEIVTSHSAPPALRHSTRAAATMFYSLLYHDLAAHTQACRWYSAALNAHRKFLSNCQSPATPGTNKNVMDLTGLEVVATSVLLAVFEGFACTSPWGFYQHFAASCNAIKMRGPENCRTGMISQIFCSLRNIDICIALLKNDEPMFSSHEWRTIPFCNSPIPHSRVIFDIMLEISSCLNIHGTCGSLMAAIEMIPDSPFRVGIEEKASQLLNDLDKWWTKFVNLNSTSTEDFTPLSIVTHDAWDDKSHGLLLHPFIFQDGFTASTVTLYCSACIIVMKIMEVCDIIGPTTTALTGNSKGHIISLCDTIFTIASFMERYPYCGLDFVRWVFPLVVVTNLSPSKPQRLQAKDMMKRWNTTLGISGICNVWIRGYEE
ncbi:hypothetical protein BGW36DRAFT_380493 [Talaromyces proteolyticus]|uniref:Zn(2)-C6 fungal-type domain-containing protein n=1 Tax=Talaromyces proteolyticus TaxID=1131652 RepID=A0AAD4KMM4_9EURO|nr:uncharacterized protein BGW36DRAFT_380493 [Talaromyces proteolyticus]KAH8696237.1 hypothetical protein BGW36DRAFT_380493 [Talaromyces proteolyticus]